MFDVIQAGKGIAEQRRNRQRVHDNRQFGRVDRLTTEGVGVVHFQDVRTRHIPHHRDLVCSLAPGNRTGRRRNNCPQVVGHPGFRCIGHGRIAKADGRFGRGDCRCRRRQDGDVVDRWRYGHAACGGGIVDIYPFESLRWPFDGDGFIRRAAAGADDPVGGKVPGVVGHAGLGVECDALSQATHGFSRKGGGDHRHRRLDNQNIKFRRRNCGTAIDIGIVDFDFLRTHGIPVHFAHVVVRGSVGGDRSAGRNGPDIIGMAHLRGVDEIIPDAGFRALAGQHRNRGRPYCNGESFGNPVAGYAVVQKMRRYRDRGNNRQTSRIDRREGEDTPGST